MATATTTPATEATEVAEESARALFSPEMFSPGDPVLVAATVGFGTHAHLSSGCFAFGMSYQ